MSPGTLLSWPTTWQQSMSNGRCCLGWCHKDPGKSKPPVSTAEGQELVSYPACFPICVDQTETLCVFSQWPQQEWAPHQCCPHRLPVLVVLASDLSYPCLMSDIPNGAPAPSFLVSSPALVGANPRHLADCGANRGIWKREWLSPLSPCLTGEWCVAKAFLVYNGTLCI